jgi:hypothetical protein
VRWLVARATRDAPTIAASRPEPADCLAWVLDCRSFLKAHAFRSSSPPRNERQEPSGVRHGILGTAARRQSSWMYIPCRCSAYKTPSDQGAELRRMVLPRRPTNRQKRQSRNFASPLPPVNSEAMAVFTHHTHEPLCCGGYRHGIGWTGVHPTTPNPETQLQFQC